MKIASSRWENLIREGYWWLHTRSNRIQSELSTHVLLRRARGSPMKSPKKKAAGSGMRAEYDFSKGVRGKYAKRFAEGSNVVVLDPDVAGVFPDSKIVNETLRAVAPAAHKRTETAGWLRR